MPTLRHFNYEGNPVKRPAADRFVSAAEVGEAFGKAPSVDWQRLRRDLDKLVD